MANDKNFVVKNGLTTQNISFVDNITTPNNTITVTMLTNDTLSFSGNTGQLFSVTDSMTGTIFAVNDISGVPSIEVDDDGTIRLAETAGNVLVGTAVDDGINKLQINGSSSFDGAVAINESGADVDFRIESDTNTHAFFLRGSDGRIGIGASDFASAVEIINPTGTLSDSSGFEKYALNIFQSGLGSGQGAGISFGVFASGTTGSTNSVSAPGAAIVHERTGGFSKGDLIFKTRLGETISDPCVERMRITAAGDVGIGTSSPGYKLEVNGSFAATTKSFVIKHPTKSNMKLRHGSLEGPENGVYIRGRLTGTNVIELPDYWIGLVDQDSITVNLSPIGRKHVWIESIENNTIIVGCDETVDCFYTVFAERKDVEKLIVEYEEQ